MNINTLKNPKRGFRVKRFVLRYCKNLTGNMEKRREKEEDKTLYEALEEIMEALEDMYYAYPVTGEIIKRASGGEYRVEPRGRMVCVIAQGEKRIDELKEIRDMLRERYNGRKLVNEVYVSENEWVVLDCRRNGCAR